MNPIVAWDNVEQTRIRVTISKLESLQQLKKITQMLSAIVGEVAHPVDTLIIIKSAHMPEGFLHTLFNIERHVAKNRHRTMLVTNNTMFFEITRSFLLGYMPNEHIRNVHLFETEEEAYEFYTT
ncbi:MAG: hypothetical protein AAFV93_23825 [Chloroflexota bacterium]